MKTFIAYLIAATAFTLPGIGLAATYNLAEDFSTISNPNGAWSYGIYSVQDTSSSFALLPNSVSDHYGFGGLNGWNGTGTTTSYPNILQNQSGGLLSQGTVQIPDEAVVFHPDNSVNGQAVVRWTAPTAATYSYTSLFTGFDVGGPSSTGGTTSGVSIYLNGVLQFNGLVTGYLATQSFDDTLALSMGDTLDFAVGYGQNGTFFNDTTGLSLEITDGLAPIPLPAAGWLLIAGLGGLVAMRKAGRTRS